MDYYVVNGELFHYGIKGQKWGVRRFQNPDGSLTAAGQQRYGVQGERAAEKALRKGASSETASAYGKAVSKRNAQFGKANSSRNYVDEYKQLGKDRKEVKRLKEQVKTEAKRNKLETKVSQKHEKRGASPESAQKLGKAYADKYFADKKFDKDFHDVYSSWWPYGKKHKARIDRMVESLNDYWIAEDNYKIQKILTEAEERRAHGWR